MLNFDFKFTIDTYNRSEFNIFILEIIKIHVRMLLRNVDIIIEFNEFYNLIF